MDSSPATQAQNDEKRAFTPKFYFILGIIFNLCLLGFFKYTDFLLENFNAFAKLANLDFEIPLPHILLPIALSFVTFQQIAFLFDCYKRTKGEISENLSINFIDYALFISFFPQLIAGPIVHHREMMPQFSQISQAKSTINYEFLAKGLFIFSIGLFKKVFIADSFAKWADAGFALAQKGQVLNIAESWATSLSYTFQLYFDFSGYCDMAIGLGLAFGIVLPLNFNSPYKSRNIAEFWRRWHITLGRFLKECLYIPLGGNRVGKVLNLRNLFIVAFLSGIWHGAGWGFVIWGVLHGVAMLAHRVYGWFVSSLQTREKSIASRLKIAEKSPSLAEGDLGGGLFENPKNSQNSVNLKANSAQNSQISQNDNFANAKSTHPQTPSAREGAFSRPYANLRKNFAVCYLKFTQSKFYAFLSWFLTFNFISLAWIFFRAENLQGALNLLKGMFGVVWVELPEKWHLMPKTLAQIGGRNDTIFYILIAILLCVFAKNSVQITQTPLTLAKALFAAALACASLYTLNLIERTSEFLYFNF